MKMQIVVERITQRVKLKFNNMKRYALLYGSFFIYSISSICAKLASNQNLPIKILLFIGLEVLCLGIYALLWQQVLKKFSLVTAMASKGIVVIFNLIWSVLLFEETISIYNIVGAVIIIGGIWVVSSDG